MTDETRRRFLQASAGVAFLAGVGHVVADDHDGNESAGNESSGNESAGNESGGEMDAGMATVSFEDQTTDGSMVTVAEAMLPEGGFVAIHDSTLLDGEVLGSVVGVSDVLDAEMVTDLEVHLFEGVPGAEFDRDSLESEETLIAMPHFDTNDDGSYDFVASEGEADGPYTDDAGDPITADGAVSVDASDDEPTGSASVRVAHLSPDAPNVDVYVDGDLTVEDLPFGDVTDYLELPAGSYAIEITAAGDAETVVFDEEVEVPAGAFTIAAIGELEGEGDTAFEVTVIEDDVSMPAEGEARVSVFHASPDAPNVDVRVAETGDALFEDVPYGEGGSVAVPAGDYRLCVYPAGGEEAVVGSDVSLEAGTAYSAFAVGYAGNEPAISLALATSETGN